MRGKGTFQFAPAFVFPSLFFINSLILSIGETGFFGPRCSRDPKERTFGVRKQNLPNHCILSIE